MASFWPHEVSPKHLRKLYIETSHQQESEPKNSFIGAAFFGVREKVQPQPFLETPLGRLSPEIREKVYRYLSVACPQSEAWIKAPFCSRKDCEENLKDVFGVQLFTTKRKADTDVAGMNSTFGKSIVESTPSNFVHLGASTLAILRVCQQLYNEAYPTFYGSKHFYFFNAKELLAYLNAIGPLRRMELEAVRIGCLFTQTPTRETENVHAHCDTVQMIKGRWIRTPCERFPNWQNAKISSKSTWT